MPDGFGDRISIEFFLQIIKITSGNHSERLEGFMRIGFVIFLNSQAFRFYFQNYQLNGRISFVLKRIYIFYMLF